MIRLHLDYRLRQNVKCYTPKSVDTRRELITRHFSDGMSVREICKAVKRTVAVIQRIMDGFRIDSTIRDKRNTRRPRNTTGELVRRIVNSSSDDRFWRAAEISREFSIIKGISMSRSTILRRLKKAKFEARKPASKPLISKKNRMALLKIAEGHLSWTEENWPKVHFRGDSKFNLIGSNGKNYYPRKILKGLSFKASLKCVKKPVKNGGGRVKVWGGIASEGVGPLIRLRGKINSRVHRNLLRQYAVSYIK